jgi:hypothetical protein
MKRSIKIIGFVLLLILAMFLLTGCWEEFIEGKITGGGWFMDEVDEVDTKCTFGFNAHGLLIEEGSSCCDPDTYDFKGEFQFNDHAGTKIHADVTGLLAVYEWFEFAEYKFTGETKEKKDEPKSLEVIVSEDGSYVEIIYDGNTWEGELQGGNITIH